MPRWEWPRAGALVGTGLLGMIGLLGSMPSAWAGASGPQRCPGPGADVGLNEVLRIAHGREARQAMKQAYLSQLEEAGVVRFRYVPRVALVASTQRAADASALDPTTSLQSNQSVRQAGLGVTWVSSLGTRLQGTYGLSDSDWTATGQPASSTRTRNATTVTLSQPLMKGAGRLAGEADERSAQRRSRSAQLQYLLGVAQDTLDTASAYLQALSSSKRVLATEDAVKTARASHQAMQGYVSAGIYASTDLRQAVLNARQREVDLDIARTDYASALLALGLRMGCDPLADWRLSDAVMPVFDVTEFVPHVDLDALPDIRLKVLDLEDAQDALEQAKDNTRPELTFTASSSRGVQASTASSNPATGLVSRSYGAALTLNVPLNDYEAKSAVSKSSSRVSQAQLGLSQAQLELGARVRDAAQAVRTAQLLSAGAREQIEVASSVYDDEQAKLRLGRSTQLQLQAAQSSLLGARIALGDTSLNVVRAELRYFQLTAQLLPALRRAGFQGLSDEP